MIPSTNGILTADFKITQPENRTFRMNREEQLVAGFTDGIEAVKQAIYLILGTERYQHVIYSRNYGVELRDLIGESSDIVLPEIERRITEALLQDERITQVTGFSFEVNGDTATVYFTAYTIYGETQMQTEVTI